MFRRLVHAATLIVLAVVVSACAQPARTTAMVANVSDATRIADNNPLKNAVALQNVTGGQETSPLWTSEVSDSDFRRALELTLKQHTLLGSNEAPLKLTTTLLKLDQPFAGFTMTVGSSVRYDIRANDGSSVFDETVNASGTATFSDAPLGVERLRLANEKSIRANIQSFMKQLIERSQKDPSSFGGNATSALKLVLG